MKMKNLLWFLLPLLPCVASAQYTTRVSTHGNNLAVACGAYSLAVFTLPDATKIAERKASIDISGPIDLGYPDCSITHKHVIALASRPQNIRHLVLYDHNLNELSRLNVNLTLARIAVINRAIYVIAWTNNRYEIIEVLADENVLKESRRLSSDRGAGLFSHGSTLGIASSMGGVFLINLPSFAEIKQVPEFNLPVSDAYSNGTTIAAVGTYRLNVEKLSGYVALIDGPRTNIQTGPVSVAIAGTSIYVGMPRYNVSPWRVEKFKWSQSSIEFEKAIETPTLARDLAVTTNGSVWQSDDTNGIRLVERGTEEEKCHWVCQECERICP